MTENRYGIEVHSINKLINKKEKLKNKIKRLNQKLNEKANDPRNIELQIKKLLQQKATLKVNIKDLTKKLNNKANLTDTSWTSEVSEEITSESEEEIPQTQMVYTGQNNNQIPMVKIEQEFYQQLPVTTVPTQHSVARFPLTGKRRHGISNTYRRKKHDRKELLRLTTLLRQKVSLKKIVKEISKVLNRHAHLANISWTSEVDIKHEISDEGEEERHQTPMAYMEKNSPMVDIQQDYYQSPAAVSKKHQSTRGPFPVTEKHSLLRMKNDCRMILERNEVARKLGTLRRSERLASRKATEAIRFIYKLIWKLLPRRPRKTEELMQERFQGESSSDWREGEFHWIKFTKRSKWIPGIVFSYRKKKGCARSITSKGTLSIHTFSLCEAKYKKQIEDVLKHRRYKRALEVFNSRNGSSYEKEKL